VTRVGRLAARLDAVEETLTEMRARVQRLELFTGVPTTLDAALPYGNGEDRGGAS
jgi:hypothetical protein